MTDALEWGPTPEDELVTAERLVDGAWQACRYADIREGDIFRAISPDGDRVHPGGDPDGPEEAVALATGDARKNDPLGSDGQWYGYGVPCVIFDSIYEIKKGAN